MKNINVRGVFIFVYISVVRSLALVAKKVGILSALESRSDQRWAQWLRSLAAIHNIDDMIYLDTPWWTYDAIDEIESFLKAIPNARVLEYGSGASTIWLGHRAGTVKSIEHDRNWFHLVQERTNALSNVEIVLKEPSVVQLEEGYSSARSGFEGLSFKEYVCEVNVSSKPYDLIIIDGRARNDCLKLAKSNLSKGGIILFDNTFRKRYKDTISTCGGIIRRFPGLAPALPYRDETSLISYPQSNTCTS